MKQYNCVRSNPKTALAMMQSLCGHRKITRPVVGGSVHVVDSPSAFAVAVANYNWGDEIRISPGHYFDWGTLNVTGSDELLVSGVGVTFTGDTRIYVVGSNITIFGFRLFECNSRFQLEVHPDSADCKVIANEIDSPLSSGSSYDVGILARGRRCEVSDNFIHDTPYLFFGCLNGSSLKPEAFDGHIHHNTFKDSISTGGNGGSALRVGLLGNEINSRVEYNHFDNWNGDGETIEIKGSKIEIFYNLMTNCGFGHTSNRWGDNNVYYANYSDGAKWNLRFNGNGNKGYFNYARSSSIGFFQAFTFFLTDSTDPTTNAQNIGANDNIIRFNISEGFANWVSTLAQGDAPYVQVSGNIVSDNIYLGIGDVGEEGSYFADDDMQPWAEYDSKNMHSNNIGLALEANTGNYCSSELREIPLSVDGFAAPSWWLEMFA